jgi:hypothetical protein
LRVRGGNHYERTANDVVEIATPSIWWRNLRFVPLTAPRTDANPTFFVDDANATLY